MKPFSYSIIALILFASCEKEIRMDLRSVEPQLVIEGLIPLDSAAKVRLTTSKDFFADHIYPPVENAVVTVSDDAGNSETLHLSPSGWYEASSLTGVEGRTYYLNVETDGKTYSSVSTMPYSVPVDSVGMYYIPAFQEAFPMVYFTDPKGVDNYYRFFLSINGKKMPGVDIDSDEERDGKRVNHIMPFEDRYNDDKGIEKGDTILIEIQYISKDAFQFFLTLAMMGMSNANPDSNIEGGALGYFSAYSFNQSRIVANWR
ncbi:MAG: DUF4249 domain-containing protein [Prevotella sp.]|jgi:hypothetical protein|nr:DUF4249 domain-containing protein [Prevotella sp.]